MSTSKKDAVQEARDFITKFKQEWDASNDKFRQEEEKFYNDNKDGSLKGWIYTKDPNSAWGGTWSKSVEKTEPEKVEEVEQVENNSEIENHDQDPVVVEKTETPLLTEDDYKNSPYFRKPHMMSNNASVTIDGQKYPIYVIQNRYSGTGKNKEENDRTYAVDPKTGKMRRVFENFLGMPYNAWSKDAGGEDWFYPSFMAGPEYEWLKANPRPNSREALGGTYTDMYKKWLQDYNAAKAVGFLKKQGGTMNRINYFQQGGAAPQQDMQKQVIALVQAAMQGDQKATETVNQIMEAAKAGDQQAVQLAQVIQQVAKQMQGQATAAKWGAKLGYIRSLKYANGGKACPTCQAGAPIKKVEEKACGGKAKKAKKRYFGGWL